jgi:hypothetical protein
MTLTARIIGRIIASGLQQQLMPDRDMWLALGSEGRLGRLSRKDNAYFQRAAWRECRRDT